MTTFSDLVISNQEWLVERVLSRVHACGFSADAPSLAEARQMAVAGISSALLGVLEGGDMPSDIRIDDTAAASTDPFVVFVVMKARAHRSRGVTLGMFMGVLKHYRQSYLDLVQLGHFGPQEELRWCSIVERFFDRVEIALCVEWNSLPEHGKLKELQDVNRAVTNEKNRLLTIFESLGEPVILLDGDNRIEALNHAATELFGGRSIHGADHPGILLLGERVPWLPDVNGESFESELATSCGSRIFQVKVQRMFNASARFCGTVVLLDDVTVRRNTEAELVRHRDQLKKLARELADNLGVVNRELRRELLEREQTEVALRKSRERFALFMQNVPGFAFIKDAQGRYVYVNEAWKKVTRKTDDASWRNKTDEDLWHSKIARKIRENDCKVLAAGTPLKFIEIICQDMQEICCYVSKFPIMGEDGAPVFLAGIATDISDRMVAERLLVAYQEQLASLAVELSLAEERERRRIASELHDQVGQTLAFTKMRLTSLQEFLSSPTSLSLVEEIRELVSQTIQEIRSLTFEISPPLLYEVGLGAALEALAESFRKKFGFSLTVECLDDSVCLSEEIKVTLYQVVRELLVNVAKHAAAAHVSLTMEAVGGGVVIRVVDDGVGFDVTEIAERRQKDGGFGLFDTRQKVLRLGGRFDIDSEIDGGTRITIEVTPGQAKMER